MSAISLPMIHSATTTNKFGDSTLSPMVNAERVTAIEIVQTQKVGSNSNSPKNEIHFTLAQDPKTGVPGEVVWKYDDDTALQADLLLIYNSISVVVA